MDEIDFAGGDVDGSLAGEFEGEKFFFTVVFDEGFEAPETADAVMDMYDKVIFFKIGKGADGLDGFNASDAPARLMLAKQFMMTQHKKVMLGQSETAVDKTNRKMKI